MIIEVPLTGEYLGDGKGNPDNPVKPVDFYHWLPVEYRDYGYQIIHIDFNGGTCYLELNGIKRQYKRLAKSWRDRILFKNGKTLEHLETDEDFENRVILTGIKIREITDAKFNEMRTSASYKVKS